MAQDSRVKEALKAFEQLIEVNPKDARAWTDVGSILFNMSKFETAFQSVETALEIDVSSGKAWHLKGLVLREMGDVKAADDSFARAKSLGETTSL